MSSTITIAILAIIATLAAAFLQPIVSSWLTPKQKLRVDVCGADYAIPSAVAREMSEYGHTRHLNSKLKSEFVDFLKNAERYQSYFNVIVTNTGKTTSRNVVLGCTAYGKYTLIHSKNKSEYRPDEPEYFLGDIQPSEKIQCKIWSSSSLSSYDSAIREMFSIRDDHNSSKEIILRRFYDKTSHYLLDRSAVEALLSALKWTALPPLAVLAFIYLITRYM